MTKPTQETLQEAVAVIVEQSLLRHGVQLHRQEGTLDDADAAIATMLERLRTPSDGVVNRGANEFAMTAQRPYIAERNALAIWQAMLAQFEKENSHD